MPNDYEYKVVKIRRDGRGDESVVANATSVINEHAREGWRLHTYSQVALGTGAMAPIASVPLTNVLHLVFEREYFTPYERKLAETREEKIQEKKRREDDEKREEKRKVYVRTSDDPIY